MLPTTLTQAFIEVESTTEEELAQIPQPLRSGRIKISQPLKAPLSLALALALLIGPDFQAAAAPISDILSRRNQLAIDAVNEGDYAKLKNALEGELNEG